MTRRRPVSPAPAPGRHRPPLRLSRLACAGDLGEAASYSVCPFVTGLLLRASRPLGSSMRRPCQGPACARRAVCFVLRPVADSLVWPLVPAAQRPGPSPHPTTRFAKFSSEGAADLVRTRAIPSVSRPQRKKGTSPGSRQAWGDLRVRPVAELTLPAAILTVSRETTPETSPDKGGRAAGRAALCTTRPVPA